MATRLDEAIALDLVKGDAEGSTWRGLITDKYNVFIVPNGGLLMALILRAMRNEQKRHGLDKESNLDCLHMQHSFLAATVGNAPCDITVRVIKRGRTLSWVSAELQQAAKVRIMAIAGFGKYDPCPATNYIPVEDVKLINTQSERFKSSSIPKGNGETRELFSRWVWNFPPGDKDVYLRMTSQQEHPDPCPTKFNVYMRHEDRSEPITVESLVAISDAAIPTIKALLPFGDMGWVPTLSFNSYLFAEPRPDLEWVYCEFNLEAASEGRSIQGVSIFDPETGALLCRASQGALNVAEQKDQSSKI
ncbi:Hypothetical Protein FCC1311_093922 [Hondaea fermentalgiana]|uniref:Acyl-coenzyme A thioesterase 8 n=1 Tax=Hondaea fermentalgiana TaxID=2315210 RepID=A0A2R5GTT9_9STRA|nr:Hypothetical Protein FCC1311_093922 [Hondaea fermentalgiana]|eukprot:GBG33168.1 Hypothetical Protein FCC1311_093922 [Hondaea fermentalgiana]